MNCNEARRKITAYVKKELPDRELEQFLDHIEHCDDCMDELDTYFMVYRALDTLDSQDRHEFDFEKMLDTDIRASYRGLVRRKVQRFLVAALAVATELLLAFSVYTGFQIKKGSDRYLVIQRAILHRSIEDSGVPEELPRELEKMIKRAEKGNTSDTAPGEE